MKYPASSRSLTLKTIFKETLSLDPGMEVGDFEPPPSSGNFWQCLKTLVAWQSQLGTWAEWCVVGGGGVCCWHLVGSGQQEMPLNILKSQDPPNNNNKCSGSNASDPVSKET